MFISNETTFSCPVEALSNILGKKWVPLIIWTLKDGVKRFGELQKEIEGCSKKMINQQLDLLISHEIVANDKHVCNNTIESFYYLTDKGNTLVPIIKTMIMWGEDNLKC